MILQVDMKMQRKAIKKGFQNVSETSWSRKKKQQYGWKQYKNFLEEEK